MAKKKESPEERKSRLSTKLDRASIHRNGTGRPTLEGMEWDDDETTDVIHLALAKMEEGSKEREASLMKSLDDIKTKDREVVRLARRVRRRSTPVPAKAVGED